MNMMIDAVASKMSVADWDNFRARSTSKPNEAQHDPGKQEYDQRIQQQAQARTYISSLDKETISQKLTRSLDISCFPEIWSGSLPEKRTRTLTTYSANGSDVEVLIEWKEWTPSLITRDEVVTRVSDIVAILSSPPSCINNILSSLGFFEDNRGNDRGMKWVGIVYDTASLGHRPRIRTMRDLLTRPAGKSREIWKPPLGDRFRLAHHLAETLLAVHNCDWLHKGLRPENIVFFSTERSINNPYLLGWDSSRSSRRGQKTEPVMSWHPDLELYQHPLWFEDPSPEDSDQSRFRIEFDHYQLGCVLLEIGLWCLIGDLKKAKGDTFSGPNWREEWKKYLEHKTKILEVEMGKIYSEVVLNLLQGLDAYGKDMEYWNVVVRQLSICTA
ncbi:hypothetical protein N431DRAFT_502980 [Stipitochalara longipes BDJ]|nr:hypothetical protein N431DRAFT_502980 [Stipitochalara longipes BDJ]